MGVQLERLRSALAGAVFVLLRPRTAARACVPRRGFRGITARRHIPPTSPSETLASVCSGISPLLHSRTRTLRGKTSCFSRSQKDKEPPRPAPGRQWQPYRDLRVDVSGNHIATYGWMSVATISRATGGCRWQPYRDLRVDVGGNRIASYGWMSVATISRPTVDVR